jgi:hypothetical protein
MIAAVEPSARTYGVRGAKPLLVVGIGLLLAAVIAAFWPHGVTFNGVHRSCNPVISHTVPSDPGGNYSAALMDACARVELPELLVMLVGGLSGFLLGGLGLAGVVQQRAGRSALYWTPPPTWPPAPVGWQPGPDWVPPPEWPPAQANWQWWQPSYARPHRSNE